MTNSNEKDVKEIVVFSILKNSECGECGAELFKGQLLRKEGESALCMACSDLDHLVFLPSGNTALTRRAKKHSNLHAVVVRFSRTRKRYERQGLLVQENALEQAESECALDSKSREAARERAALRRADLDAEYVFEFARSIRERFPGCPPNEETEIAEHACRKYSGRVGRSAFAKQFDSSAIDLAVTAHVRHVHTDYDSLLAMGHSREMARAQVISNVKSILSTWRNSSAGSTSA